MFQLQEHVDPIWWNVDIEMPVGVSDANKKGVKKHRIKVAFVWLDQDAMDSAVDEGDVGFFQRIIDDWTGVKAADGTDLKATADNIAKVVSIPYVRRALVNAHSAMRMGVSAKN